MYHIFSIHFLHQWTTLGFIICSFLLQRKLLGSLKMSAHGQGLYLNTLEQEILDIWVSFVEEYPWRWTPLLQHLIQFFGGLIKFSLNFHCNLASVGVSYSLLALASLLCIISKELQFILSLLATGSLAFPLPFCYPGAFPHLSDLTSSIGVLFVVGAFIENYF